MQQCDDFVVNRKSSLRILSGNDGLYLCLTAFSCIVNACLFFLSLACGLFAKYFSKLNKVLPRDAL